MVEAFNAQAGKVLTIFTPAYNRGNLLPRLFDSIRDQADAVTGVEWLIIDDGSTDKTMDVIKSFREVRPELVRYASVSNGGKHRAINRAAKLANGRWIMIVDSDDTLAENAIASVLECIKGAESGVHIGLLRGLRRFSGEVESHEFRLATNPGTYASWVSSQKGFDTAEVVRKVALQQAPFPEFEGERFMAESWLWHQIDAQWLTHFINKQWVICEYLDGGLSDRSAYNRSRSPLSAMAVYEKILSANVPFSLKARASVNWWRYRWHAGRSATGASSLLSWQSVFALAGWIAYKKDRLQVK